MSLKLGLEEHIEMYITEIANAVGRDPEMRHYPLAFTEAVVRSIAYAVRPQVEVVSEVISETKSCFIFRVISPPVASFVGGCLGNDTNAHLHTGEAAITQSNALFAICTDAVMRSYKEGSFTLAEPLEFRTALPFGKPVLVTIEIGPRKRLTRGSIEVKLEENSKLIFPKAKIHMVRMVRVEPEH